MYILILTKRDGTLFNVTSVLEEDIIKICIWLGHTHPMGVLHYSVTKSIMLFQSADNMQCTTCRAIKVMVLYEEAIAIRVSPHSTTHVRVLWLWWVGNHPQTSLHPLMGMRNSIFPLVTPTHLGGTLQHLQVDLRIWQMMNCASLWRISAERSHSMS